MVLVEHSFLAGNNGLMLFLVGTCKTNIVVGPPLVSKRVDLMSDKVKLVLYMLLRWASPTHEVIGLTWLIIFDPIQYISQSAT